MDPYVILEVFYLLGGFMKILGMSALNSNNYRKISMYKNINVLGSNNKENLEVSDRFNKSLKGKSDIEKRDDIVRYFLRNHQISLLYEDEKDIIIQSKDGVELIIDRGQSLSKNVLKEAINKYNSDKMESYATNEVDFYWMMSDYGFSSVSMGYLFGVVDDFHREMKGLPEEFSNKKCMIMDIGLRKKYINGRTLSIDIDSREKDFFNRMLLDIENVEFYGYSNDYFRNLAIYKCIINEKEVFIVIPRELSLFSYLIDEKIKNDRKDIDSYKKLQYKMEGF